MHDALLALLQMRRGAGQAITARELAARLGTHERAVREMIRELRLQGYLICSTTDTPGGFFMHPSPEEREHYLRHLVSRAREIFAVVDAQQRAAGQEDARQLGLWEATTR
jgi:predicted DNA-binding transcriptional regulator YafY